MSETILSILQSATGLVGLPALAWAFSENRRLFPWRKVVVGVALQMAIIGLMFKLPGSASIFEVLNRVVTLLQDATLAGTGFVFGYLGGGPSPFDTTNPSATFILAFQALPLMLVISSLTAVLYYFGILQVVVRGFAWVFGRTLGTGGAVGFGISANIFVGMIEAPMFIRPYLGRLNRSELFLLMTCGMATIAGTVMALYAAILHPVLPDSMGHILIASIVSVPAAISIASIMVPATEPQTSGELVLEKNAGQCHGCIDQGRERRHWPGPERRGPFDRAGGLGQSGELDICIVSQYHRPTPKLGTNVGLGHGPGYLDDGHSRGSSRGGRKFDGPKNDFKRTGGVPFLGGAPSRNTLAPKPGDHDIRHVRFRQFRESWDHDRRDVGHGAGSASGNRGVGAQIHCIRNPFHVHDRSRGRSLVLVRGPTRSTNPSFEGFFLTHLLRVQQYYRRPSFFRFFLFGS